MACIMCKEPSKYKCPGCLSLTCSVKCVKSHKTKYSCSGMPDKTKYEGIKDINTNTMHRDINFLSDIIRSSDQAHKVITKLSRHDNRKRFLLLQNECRARNIQLRILPKAMSKHNSNSTVFMKSENIIYWRIEWVFLSNNKEIKIEVDGNKDHENVLETLGKAIEIFNTMPEFVHELSKSPSKEFWVLWIVGKKRVQGKGEKVFQRIDAQKALNETLKENSQEHGPIVEFPTLYITTPDFSHYHFIKN
ncbi:unnamed protein product [Blepharisma stoltei]|uniref:HIT-type domain-containing protein n=1 Tax=Blepharisma stoltei TaxID=1481888 RepID=A0AAU9JG03_9CILI|nr:unnamed protein product [Blepharisma stoltei]